MTSRREFLAGMAAAGASTLMQSTAPPATRRAIDVHHHLVPPKVLAAHRDEFARVGALGGNETMTRAEDQNLLGRSAAGIEPANAHRRR